MIGKLKTVVLDAPDIAKLAGFYAALAGWTQSHADDEWINLDTPDGWQIGFQRASDHVPPRWPDPEYPQQFHIDMRVPDIDAAADRATELGATRLGGGATWHTLADPAGHPFDLCRNEDDPATSIFAVTVDTDDAKGLSRFYADLLGMEIQYDGDEGSLIGTADRSALMFQRIEHHTRPNWPDPSAPQQFHLDIAVEDIDKAEPAALAIGATRLDGGGKSFRVFADPSGHPFCLVW
jgi:catechol-2,3-dioxygenase